MMKKNLSILLLCAGVTGYGQSLPCVADSCCLAGTVWSTAHGGCVIDETYCSWQPDSDGDQLIGVSDLLMFLSVFGDTDLDQDGIFDSNDDCVGEYDECGVCNGSGPSIPIIESIEILYDSVYAEPIDEWLVFEIGTDTNYQYLCDLNDCLIDEWSEQDSVWNLYGSDIFENASAYYNMQIGRRVAVNGTGSIIAMGGGGGGTIAPAEVRVFQRSDISWVQRGQTLVGEDSGVQAVDLSESGNILAVGQYQGGDEARGKVTVYQYNEETQHWGVLGAQIFGNPSEYLGEYVSLSRDGNTISCDYSIESIAKATRVYAFDGSSWGQKGEDIIMENVGLSNHVVSDLNEDGNVLAIGYDQFDGKGLVQVFSFSEGTWDTLGQGILGEDAGDYCGTSISINPNGNIIAIGEPGSNVESTNTDPNWNDAGQARIFKLESDQWVQLGQDINGTQGADYFGYSVSLSGDGESLAIGAPNSVSGEWTGYVKTYQWVTDSWVEGDSTFIGEGPEDYFGQAVALSTDKTTLVVGAPEFNDGFGYVRIINAEACFSIAESWWQCGDPLEYQGYDYETVQIGEQCWFAENLLVAETSNGSVIEDLGEEDWPYWSLGPSDYPCVRRVVSASNVLYTWNCTSITDNICPSGWFVPAREDFLQLVEFVEGTAPLDLTSFPSSEDIKSIEWGNNNTGFNLLPHGRINDSGVFQLYDFIDNDPWAFLWSSSADSHPSQDFEGGSPFQIWDQDGYHNLGGSAWGNTGGGIRCLKDTE